MQSPWLQIPLADYERHMALPGVAQAPLLADLLAESVARYRPESLAVPGCAGGNGFDRIPPDRVRRVVAIDINPDYVATAGARYAGRFADLQCITGDLQTDTFAFEPVDLVYAALVFEYVEPALALPRLREMLRPRGVLVTVVQLPGEGIAAVTPSPFTGLAVLGPSMRLVAPEDLAAEAARVALVPVEARTVRAGGGKEFRVQVYRRA